MATVRIKSEENRDLEKLDLLFPFYEKRKIFQIFIIATSLILISSAFNNQHIGELYSAQLLYGLTIFTIFTLFFIRKNWFKISLSYYFILISTTIFYFDSYAGVDSGSYLFYFPLLFAIANLFNFKSKTERHQLIFHISLVAIFTLINVFTDHQLFQKDSLSTFQEDQIFKLNFTFSIIAIGFFMYMIIRNNMKHNLILENSVIEENKLRVLQTEKTRDKEILLAELQHRLKNNLSLLSSLLKLKMNDADKDPTFALKEGIHAVQVVAHANHLQRFENDMILVPIAPLCSEIKSFWFDLFENYPIDGDFTIQCVSEELSVKQAIPMSLILQELICEFWLVSFELKTPSQLVFTITKNASEISIHIHSSVENLVERSANRKFLIDSLTEQIDGEIHKRTEYEHTINFTPLKVSPILESSQLFD